MGNLAIKKDFIIIFYVGGEDKLKKVSTNLIYAIDFALKKNVKCFRFSEKKEGMLKKNLI